MLLPGMKRKCIPGEYAVALGIMTLRQIEELLGEYQNQPSGDYPTSSSPADEKMRNALAEYQAKNSYPGGRFYRLASEFYEETEDMDGLLPILDRWKKAKGDPVEPFVRISILWLQDLVSDAVANNAVQDGLARDQGNRDLLVAGYQLVSKRGDGGRSLYYSLQLTKVSPSADDFIMYGIECGRNLMPDAAEKAFEKAGEIDDQAWAALNGLGRCQLERLQISDAEECFKRAMDIKPTPFAERNLKVIERLRNGKAWTDEEKRLRKFWEQWEEAETDRISEERRQQLMAKAVAKETR